MTLADKNSSARLGSYTSVGTLVRYVPSEDENRAAKWGANLYPSAHLDPTHTYSVERVEVHSWHTKLWLEGVGGPFNSVHFVEAQP